MQVRVFIAAGAAFLFAVVARAQVPPIQIEHDITTAPAVSPLTSDRFTWHDSSNQPRVAVLAHDNNGVMNPDAGNALVYGMALREFRYQVGGTTRIADVTTYGNGGYGGFGYVVDHSNAGNCVGDDSPLGDYTPYATFQRIFEGRHHVIFRYTQNYPRNCPNQSRTIPVTIDWIFSTGRDNPVYAITYDVASAAAADVLNDDSRAPYGELNIDGSGATNIDGVAWGDRYKFFSKTAPLTLNSDWDYTQTNSVPYVKEWIVSTDATIGLVETQTIDQQDGGGARYIWWHDITPLWGNTSATMAVGNENNYHADCPYTMPCQNEWAYQANADSLGPATSNNNARMTWRTQWGFIGQTQYDAHDPNQRLLAGYPKKSYSVYVVLGQHSTGPVETQVGQVETVQSLSLTANGGVGSVVAGGPAGVADSTSVTYAPAGYNHIYGALAFSAMGNNLDANIAVGPGTLKKPLIIISNFTSLNYPTVKLAGTTLTADVDYFPSLRSSASELWITLNSDLTGVTNHFEIVSTSDPPATPYGLTTVAVSSTQINLSWNAVSGASSYQVDRKSSLGGAYVQIGTPMTNSFPDSGLASNTAYLYRVRAVNGFGASSSSSPHLSTTVVYTDNPLAAGVTVKATHLAELRNAVNAVRTLAASGTVGFTDAATAGTIIKAVHITELRNDLGPALTTLGFATSAYTDTLLGGVAIKGLHFQELRDRMQ